MAFKHAVLTTDFAFVLDRLIRHRACALKDTVHAIIKDELDEDFEKMCVEIKESRMKRGSVFVLFICFCLCCCQVGLFVW